MKKIPIRWAVALSIGAIASSNLSATTTEEMDLSAMTKAAAVIVAGEVVSNRTERVNNVSTTIVEFRVNDEIKGDTSELIKIKMPGGSFQSGRFRVGESFAGMPRMFKNQDALVFLSLTEDKLAYHLVDLTQGYMAINDTKDGPTLQNSITGGKAMPLKMMKQQINAMEAK